MSEPKEKELRLLGVSYRTASVAERECFARLAAETETRLATVSGPRKPELVVVSTCNRCEIYTWASPHGDCLAELRRRFDELTASRQMSRSSGRGLYCLRGTSAARHLFEVSCGLDSAILGDLQILSQVKRARLHAERAGGLEAHLDRLFQIAVRTGKRSRHETEIGFGSASVGSALVSTIRNRSKSATFRILLIGAGDAARNIGLHLKKAGMGPIVCMNRTARKAEELADRLEGASRSWDELHRASLESDLIIAATSAPEPILRRTHLAELARRRPQDSILVVDAGLPRNVEGGSPLEVIGIDQVRERQEEVMSRRRASLPSVERIVRAAIDEWERWLASQPMEEVVKDLFRQLPDYTERTACRLVGGDALTPERARQILGRSIRKLLYDHVRRLRTMDIPSRHERMPN